MRTPDAPTPPRASIAPPGMLDPAAAEDVRLFRQILAFRDSLSKELYGRAMRPSILRQELQRLVILEFAAGQTCTVAYYQKLCARLGTPPTVRAQIAFLEQVDCLVLAHRPGERKTLLVHPTRKLIEFYNQQMPIFRSMIIESFRGRENLGGSGH